MPSRSICVVANGRISVFLMPEQHSHKYMCVCLDHIFLPIHLWTDTWAVSMATPPSSRCLTAHFSPWPLPHHLSAGQLSLLIGLPAPPQSILPPLYGLPSPQYQRELWKTKYILSSPMRESVASLHISNKIPAPSLSKLPTVRSTLGLTHSPSAMAPWPDRDPRLPLLSHQRLPRAL